MARTNDSNELFRSSIAIDGLDTSRWGREAVYRDLKLGGVTAINATIAIWDDFHSTMGHITNWLRWFDEYSEFIRPVHSVADIEAAKKKAGAGSYSAGKTPRPSRTTSAAWRFFTASACE